MKAKVKFLPQDIELEIDPDQSVMELAHKNDIFIKSICNGLPSCAECRVKLVEGEHNVLAPFQKELGLIGTGHFVDQRRLSCQLHCYGDITIDLSEQVEKEKAGPKRPQGSKKTETEESYAVTGSLIEQNQDVMSEVKPAKEDARDDGSVAASGSDFYKDLNKSKPQQKSGKDGGGKSRSRNRNRNRNRKRRSGKYRPHD